MISGINWVYQSDFPGGWRAKLARSRNLVLVLSTFVIAVAATACGGEQTEGFFPVRGRTLEVHVDRPIFSKQILYVYKGRVMKLEIPDPSKRLVAVRLDVVNRNITFVPLTIDSESAELGDSLKSIKFKPLDPAEGSHLEGIPPETGVLSPSLWGEIELTKGTQASGWLFFEVPVGLRISALWWIEADSIVIRFSDPERAR